MLFLPLLVNNQASVNVVRNIIETCEHSAACVLEGFTDYVAKVQKEQAFETALREKMAKELETYACDQQKVSSEPIKTTTWRDLHVSIMHELPSSKIHLINGFISNEECEAIMDIADKTNLGHATVSGGPKYSSFRKALQTNVQIPWKKEGEGNLIAQVARRVYDYTNHVMEGLNINEHGQSSFKYLHYSGRGRDDTDPDHYSAHCDGIW
jgi:hypothetical protein